MPGFKFNEPHFCWTVIISIPWSQTQMNYRNPACDSPTPWDGKRHLEGNLGWIWREFFGRNAARLLRSSFQEQDTNCRSWKLWEVVFWILASHQSLRGFLSSTVPALENTLRMLKLWNFPAVWGHYWEEKLVTDFWRCMLCSLHWSPPSPAYPASTSWEFLGNPAVISGVPIPGKSAVNGNTALFVWELPSVLPCILQAELSMENEV